MMFHKQISATTFFLIGGILCTTIRAQENSICISESKTYTAVVDLYASELGKFVDVTRFWESSGWSQHSSILLAGYFTFAECPGMITPTIGIEVGESYTFVQNDITNWMHPMGFAYGPHGAHADEPELEAGLTKTDSSCANDFSCPTPRYYKGATFLGINGTDDFGLGKFIFVLFLLLNWFGGVVLWSCLLFNIDFQDPPTNGLVLSHTDWKCFAGGGLSL